MNVDAVAEAICNGANTGTYGELEWSQLVERHGDDSARCEMYRRMARAAIEAMGLRQETIFTASRVWESRFVSPWVRTDG